MSTAEMNAQWRIWRAQLDAYLPQEAGHADRVAVYAVATGERMGLADEELLRLRFAAAVHDLGKLDLPVEVFVPTEPISAAAVLEIRRHPELGAARLAPRWPEIAPLVLAHHERWDGNGYPHRLVGEAIPRLSRIISVAEAFDAMTHTSSARPSLLPEEAANELRRNVRKQFDAKVVAAFIEVIPLIQPVEANSP